MINVKIVSLSPDNEDEVLISIEGQEIVCFITSSPYLLNVGQEYLAELTLFFIEDNYEITLSESESGFKRVDGSYCYYLCGELKGENLIVNNINFYDDSFLNFYDLEGKSVIVKVDRIDVAFL